MLAEKLELGVMKAIEFKPKERLVTQSVGLAQEGFDLVVDALHSAVVDAMFPPVQDSASMEREGFGQLLHLANARVDSPLAPLFEECLHLVEGRFRLEPDGHCLQIPEPPALPADSPAPALWTNQQFRLDQ